MHSKFIIIKKTPEGLHLTRITWPQHFGDDDDRIIQFHDNDIFSLISHFWSRFSSRVTDHCSKSPVTSREPLHGRSPSVA